MCFPPYQLSCSPNASARGHQGGGGVDQVIQIPGGHCRVPSTALDLRQGFSGRVACRICQVGRVSVLPGLLYCLINWFVEPNMFSEALGVFRLRV